MGIQELGIEGEKKAREVVKKNNFNCFGTDWILIDKLGNYYLLEVKCKEMFAPPPFEGQGLNINQVVSKQIFFKKTGIRTILLIMLPDNKRTYWQFLDKLEQGKHFDTKNKVRIYPISSFEWEETLKEVANGTKN